MSERGSPLTAVVGDMFPSASVLGTDLSPIQSVWVPMNVRFLVDDAEYVEPSLPSSHIC